MLKTAVLVSGGGTNLNALLKAEMEGKIKHTKITLVIADRPCPAIGKANKNGKKTILIDKTLYRGEEFTKRLLTVLEDEEIDIIVLAGFLKILSSPVIKAYKDRIINIHPSLIPSFSGKGFYGIKVHEEALKRGVKITGATVHLVNEIPDGGKILLQKSVLIGENDNPETLQKKVMEEAEWIILPKALEELASKITKEIKL